MIGRSSLYYREEAQELSDHIAIMAHGKIIACGTHDELVEIVGEMDRMREKVTAMQNSGGWRLLRWRLASAKQVLLVGSGPRGDV